MKKDLMLLFAIVSISWGFQAKADTEKRLISVSGSASKSMSPNLISFNLEVWAKSGAAQRTQALAADETKRILKVLENYKIPKNEIQTESFQFGPEYVWDQPSNQNKMIGFSSVQNFRVTLKNVEQAGRLIDALTVAEKGAEGQKRREFGTNVNRIQWDSTERKTVEVEATGLAVKAARSQADVMAKAAGVKIKNVYRVSNILRNEGGPRPMMAKMAMAADAAPESTSLEGGAIQVEVTVYADYEIQ